MNFRPIDEISLRHLFSTAYAQEILKFSYINPVLNAAGVIETSPDCMILDMRKHPFRPLRCEFKFSPSSKDDFSQNGRFDIAIIWYLPKGRSKEQLRDELFQQNRCTELVVLEDIKAFQELPIYTVESLSRLDGSDTIRSIAIEKDFPSVFGLCMAAKLYPEKFQMDHMLDFLAKRFSSVKKMQPQGRANVISAFLQTKPPLLERRHGNYYRFTAEFDSVVGVGVLTQLIIANFDEQPPSDDDLKSVS